MLIFLLIIFGYPAAHGHSHLLHKGFFLLRL